MEKQLKRNESCIIGLPRCDYVFDSNRSCFIAYGFQTSKLEVDILCNILASRNIEAFEAAGFHTPGKNVFCAKICSKIITSQFCIVLLNEDDRDGVSQPNANVHMEYGLMLGMNKYVIPLQRAGTDLTFNVSGFDSIEYTMSNFKEKATQAIDQAIEETKPQITEKNLSNKEIEHFLIAKGFLVCPINDLGHQNIQELGSPLGYDLLVDFSGFKYVYLGVFNHLNPAAIKWKLTKLVQIIMARFANYDEKMKLGIANAAQVQAAKQLIEQMEIWIIVSGPLMINQLNDLLPSLNFKVQFFTMEDIIKEVKDIV